MLDLRHVQTFVALAECLHFGRASEQLGIAQPHVSRRIKQLEQELDVLLLLRDKRNVALTEAGKGFLVEARTLLEHAALAQQRAKETATGRRGRLGVSLTSSAMLGILPTILSDFHKRHPNVYLSFREMGSVVQMEALAHASIDVAFVHPPTRTPPAFEQLLLESEPLVAVLSTAHPLARRKQLDLADLGRDPWIMFPRSESMPIYDRIIAVCQKAGFSPNIVQEAGPMQTRLGLVAAGFGVHLIQAAWQTMPYPGVVYLPIEPTATIGHACYWRRGNANPVLAAFLEVVRKHRP